MLGGAAAKGPGFSKTLGAGKACMALKFAHFSGVFLLEQTK